MRSLCILGIALGVRPTGGFKPKYLPMVLEVVVIVKCTLDMQVMLETCTERCWRKLEVVGVLIWVFVLAQT